MERIKINPLKELNLILSRTYFNVQHRLILDSGNYAFGRLCTDRLGNLDLLALCERITGATNV